MTWFIPHVRNVGTSAIKAITSHSRGNRRRPQAAMRNVRTACSILVVLRAERVRSRKCLDKLFLCQRGARMYVTGVEYFDICHITWSLHDDPSSFHFPKGLLLVCRRMRWCRLCMGRELRVHRKRDGEGVTTHCIPTSASTLSRSSQQQWRGLQNILRGRERPHLVARQAAPSPS